MKRCMNMEKNILYNNMIYDLIYKIVNMIYVSFLWLVFCLPIVTIGASTTSLYYVVNKTIRHERGKIFQGFWHSFKLNFKQSTIVWLFFLLIYSIGAIDYLVLRSLNLNGKVQNIFVWLLLFLIVVVSMVANYIFPYIARFENRTSEIVKNSILIAVMSFGKSFVNVVLLAITIIVSIFVPFFIAISPAIYMLFLNKSIEPVFERYMSSEDLEKERNRNRNYS